MRSKNRETFSRIVFAASAGLVICIIAAIFIFIGLNAHQTFTKDHVSFAEFFTKTDWSADPSAPQAGAYVLILGTLLVTILSVLIATPLSVGIALFVTEIAPVWARRFMQPVLELLSGMPSIIFGFLGLELVVPFVSHTLNGLVGQYYTTGFGVIAAAIVLTVMILPTITTISIDALAVLPNGIREASLALGATRWQSIVKTLVPAAASGIFTGVILGTGRAIGETLAVSYVIGANPNSFPIKFSNIAPYITFRSTSTITVQLLSDFNESDPNSLSRHAIWTLCFVLLLISFALVVASRYAASRGVYRAPREAKTPTVATQPEISAATIIGSGAK